MTLNGSNRIASLDGWRGIAILMVMVSHASLSIGMRGLDLGLHGVEIFFVLSGMLITGNLLRELDQTKSISLGRFYLRRFRRLMPAAWAYMLLAGAVFSVSPFAPSAWEWVSALTFWRNYFHPTQPSLIIDHFWSLSVEEQFYFVWPALLVIFRRRAVWVAAALAGGSFLWRAAGVTNPHYTQFNAAALLVGCLISLVPFEVQAPELWLALLSLIGVLASYQDVALPLIEPLLIAILLRGSLSAWSFRRILEVRPLVWLGKISYSVYLWQNIFLNTPFTSRGALVLKPLLAIACGYASWRLLEHNHLQRERSETYAVSSLHTVESQG